MPTSPIPNGHSHVPLPPPVSTDPTDPTSPNYDPSIANPLLKPNSTASVINAEVKANDNQQDDNAVSTVRSNLRRLRTLEQQLPNYINTVAPKKVNKKGG